MSLILLLKEEKKEVLKTEILEKSILIYSVPKGLKTLAIYQQKALQPEIFNHDLMVAAFSRLKSLESLTLSGSNLFQLAEVLLRKALALLNLKKLNVQPFEVRNFGSSSKFNLNRYQPLQNLRHLKITDIAEESFSQMTNPPFRLESLDMAARMNLNELVLISQFISLFSKSLKSLKIDIIHTYEEVETEEKIKVLFSKISELEMLTSLKFKVQNPVRFSSTVLLSPNIIESLHGLFSKPVKLESFEWNVPQFSEWETVLELLKPLEESRFTLKKLTL